MNLRYSSDFRDSKDSHGELGPLGPRAETGLDRGTLPPTQPPPLDRQTLFQGHLNG